MICHMDNLGAIDEDVHGALVHHVEVVPVVTLLDDNLMMMMMMMVMVIKITSPAPNSAANMASKMSCVSVSSRWLKRTLFAIDFFKACMVFSSLGIT